MKKNVTFYLQNILQPVGRIENNIQAMHFPISTVHRAIKIGFNTQKKKV